MRITGESCVRAQVIEDLLQYFGGRRNKEQKNATFREWAHYTVAAKAAHEVDLLSNAARDLHTQRQLCGYMAQRLTKLTERVEILKNTAI